MSNVRLCEAMSRLMLNREELAPPGYAERKCLLVKYRLPGLRHCYVLCHEPIDRSSSLSTRAELLAFFYGEAQALAFEATGDAEAFLLIHSGASVRKRQNWHLHLFIVRHRWQKAWVYSILAAKNIAVVAQLAIKVIFAQPAAPNPSVKGTSRKRAAPYVER
jgi:hypothetical protein